jgi:tetratricopeptide (TPR) repeat protein
MQPQIQLDEGLRAFKSRQYAQAETQFKHALALAPDHAPCYVNLSAALHAQGKCDEAVAVCQQGLQKFPQNADLLGNLAVNLDTAGRLDEALALLERTVAENPQNARAHHHIGSISLKTGQLERAEQALKRASDLNPRDILSFSGRGEALLKAGRAAEAVDAFDAALRLNVYDVRSLALKTLALAETGRTEEERWLSDPHRLAGRHRLAETGYSPQAIQALNAELAEFALGHPSMQLDPPQNATYKGYHSGNLALARNAAVDKLKNFIAFALEERRKGLAAEDPKHPFVRAVPRAFNLHLWSVKLAGEGKMVPHIHTSGWLSGVYYVDVPDAVNDPQSGQAGWLRLGPARHDIPMTKQPLTNTLQPEPGLMFTFPSYVWHETVPLPPDSGTRLCYSYDLQPG